MEKERSTFFISIIIVSCLTMLFTLVPIWQLVIIPGIVAGLINKRLKFGVLSGLIGITLSWGLYILVGVITRNTHLILDQFGVLIFGEGLVGLIIMFIIFIAAIFGIIGGGIGNGLLNLIDAYFEKHTKRDLKENTK